jgi:hypothetical protein
MWCRICRRQLAPLVTPASHAAGFHKAEAEALIEQSFFSAQPVYGDLPSCADCGAVMGPAPSGTFRCLNCGSTSGCS